MTVKSISTGKLALLALWLSTTASAQTITTRPLDAAAPAVTAVPVDNPLALAGLFLLLAFAGWWSLRRSHVAQRVASLVLVGALAGLAGHSSGLMAQVLNAFTDSSGETLSIGVVPITAGGFTGFQPADFSNASGVALKIEAIDPPNLAECFATNPANTLLPAGTPVPSPHPACTAGATLASSAVCRIDVEAICRALAPEPVATLTALSPSSGSTAGGTLVTLTGTGLSTTTGVTFGGIAATLVTVINPTTITAITPAHPAGVVDVEVLTASGPVQALQSYTFLPALTLTQVSPNVGTTSGGTVVTLTGSGLTGATEVTFGGIPASQFFVSSATTISAVTPAHLDGLVDVTVTTPGGTAQLSSAYAFLGAPTVTQTLPSSGPTSGGTSVTLTGNGLTGATEVRFGGVAASQFVVTSATTITAVTPAHLAGTVDVTVTAPGGIAHVPSAYTFLAAPTLTQILPNSGPTSGGTSVTLTGSGLASATGITFGGIAATVSTVTATTITLITPAHAAGVVDVVVTTQGGTASAVESFNYLPPAVGQIREGGVIAALGGGLNNLIAANQDISAGVAWFSSLTPIGPSAQSASNGAGNTAAIVAAPGGSIPQASAAGLCSAFEVDSLGNTPCQPGNSCYSDWFLPAKNQLAALYDNRAAVGGFSSDMYWSSSESPVNPNYAEVKIFSSGFIADILKMMTVRARCVRHFTP
ncbi:midcut-by-XrtH protein [Ottowia thiooxydans]|uniref:IPT/TIG domain-containing protein n=1 Tax=Ottowia thiooxydans TaxID=219182 RepID=A0ABV2Q4L3_9BURK